MVEPMRLPVTLHCSSHIKMFFQDVEKKLLRSLIYASRMSGNIANNSVMRMPNLANLPYAKFQLPVPKSTNMKLSLISNQRGTLISSLILVPGNA